MDNKVIKINDFLKKYKTNVNFASKDSFQEIEFSENQKVKANSWIIHERDGVTEVWVLTIMDNKISKLSLFARDKDSDTWIES